MSTPLKARIAAPRSLDREVSGVRYNRSTSGRSKFEMLAWLYMRLSGVFLLILVGGHLLVNLIMPPEGVHSIDFGFVGGKWANPFWQVWDLLLLWLAMLHGANGMRTIIDDYAERDGVRFWLKLVLTVVTAFIILLGTLVVFTFDPCPANADPSLLASVCSA